MGLANGDVVAAAAVFLGVRGVFKNESIRSWACSFLAFFSSWSRFSSSLARFFSSRSAF